MMIRELQKTIEATFGERDRKRGIERSFLWFIEETGELAEAIRHGAHKEIEHEIGDVLAWLLSVANLAGVDVEKAAHRYSECCPCCHSSPCKCDSN